jgi:hypothetical protein
MKPCVVLSVSCIVMYRPKWLRLHRQRQTRSTLTEIALMYRVERSDDHSPPRYRVGSRGSSISACREPTEGSELFHDPRNDTTQQRQTSIWCGWDVGGHDWTSCDVLGCSMAPFEMHRILKGHFCSRNRWGRQWVRLGRKRRMWG